MAKRRSKKKLDVKKMNKEKSTYEKSNPVKKFKTARTELLKIPGPNEKEFLQLGFAHSKKKSYSFE